MYLLTGEKLHEVITEFGLQLSERSPLVGHLLTHTLAAWSRPYVRLMVQQKSKCTGTRADRSRIADPQSPLGN